METTAVSRKSLDPLMDQFDLHSLLFKNVIEGISDKDANNRLNTKANHPSWITGSLVQERFELAGLLGSSLEPSQDELFRDHKGIQDNTSYPALHEFIKDWEKITPVLRTALLNFPAEKLEETAPIQMGGDISYYELIYFTIDRESYCIGQLGLWRRLLGYPAMKYPE
jgi:hypothetical protein